MVDTMRIERCSIVHKPPTGWIKQRDKVARQTECPRGRSVKTHSVNRKLLIVCNAKAFCIAFRVQ